MTVQRARADTTIPFLFARTSTLTLPDTPLLLALGGYSLNERNRLKMCALRLLIDNCGQQSPRQLTLGLENLSVGQDVMSIFDLVAYERDRHLTIRIKPRSSASRTFGDIAGSYMSVPLVRPALSARDSVVRSPRPYVDRAVEYRIEPCPTEACRLLVKLIGRNPPGIRGRLMGTLLPWGDLIMMRRQLLNFKQLAEKQSSSR